MNLDDVLEQAAHARPGYSLASFKEAALPVYVLTARVLTLEKKHLSPIEEGFLRAVDAGLKTPEDISAFLGLSLNLLTTVMAGLNGNEHISYSRGIGEKSASVTLTVKGRFALTDCRMVVPQERIVKLTFDPLLKRIIHVQPSALFKPREAKENGWLEVPLCGSRRPEVEDVPLQDIDRALDRLRRPGEDAGELLLLRRIERREMFFLPCILLYYKSIGGNDVHVAFFRDDGFSSEHESAFRDIGGPEQVGANHVLAPPELPRTTDIDASDLSRDIHLPEQLTDDSTSSIVKFVNYDASGVTASKNVGSQDVGDGRMQLQNSPTLKTIRCHEHQPLLKKALLSSKSRLLIVSPWIRDQVVNKEFVTSLESLLRNGVKVYIGYGLVEEQARGRAVDPAKQKPPITQQAKRELDGLVRRFPNFTFTFVGNTHRKLLISDNKFAVSTSFNWLSFRGDPKDKPRDESGTLILKPEYVDTYFMDGLDLLKNGYEYQVPQSGDTVRSKPNNSPPSRRGS
ncbi:hypothetical protein [Collimonas pratensis]|uniref:PLD-like domain protein n=1 Tax=Collimonas pratensis TaxID=279113 RepID=A0A127QC84_9BURK|nr:hypothetical protein [Collimonas pratensis]AMP07647.1 hypothetical protein CPter91_5361 [Collimonas pratensis]